jgi:hypothetical protein
MHKLLLAALLLSLGLGSCTVHQPHGPQVPKHWIRHYRHEQRQHERQRRREGKVNITWSQL